MVDEKEFFEEADKLPGRSEIIDAQLTRTLKENRDELMQLYAKLIANHIST